MIKTEDNITKIFCDSCKVKIAACENFNFEDEQEMRYGAWMCDACSTEHNKFVGDLVKEVTELMKDIKKLGKLLE